MIRKLRFIFLFALLATVAASCSDYQKILKSTDYEFKYKKAKEYYDNSDFNRATTLYQELVNIYRGTSRADQVYYYLAKSYFGQKDYLLAGHYFRQLLKEFPRSDYSEEAQYMIGYCYYKNSPNPRLDQEITHKGIDALQLYINLYPNGKDVKEATKLIDELREKLVYKSYLSGRLYYDLGDYRAAVVSLSNSLKDFPDSEYREELMFLLLKSKYLLAENSIPEKKEDRLNAALDEYYTFIDDYPNSDHRKEVDKFFNNTKKMLNITDEDLKIDSK
jgi:outer membrane protein assembly factor BamD